MASNRRTKLDPRALRFLEVINESLDKHTGLKLNGKTARLATVKKHREVVVAAYLALHELGFQIQNPTNISDKHLKALVDEWAKRGLSLKTMVTYRSRLVIYLVQIGKSKNFFKELSDYLPSIALEQRREKIVPERTASWERLEINIVEKIRQADEVDGSGRFGLILRVMVCFGLSLEEALSCKPWVSSLGGPSFSVFPSQARGSRPRQVPIKIPEQQALLDFVKSRVKKDEMLRWHTTSSGKTGSLEWSKTRFYYYMRQIGLTRNQSGGTALGLQTQYRQNISVIKGLVPSASKVDDTEPIKPEIKHVWVALSDLSRYPDVDLDQRLCKVIGDKPISVSYPEYSGVVLLAISRTTPIAKGILPKAVKVDCFKILGELADIDCNLTLSQVFTLWSQLSAYAGIEWLKPDALDMIISCIYLIAKINLAMPLGPNQSEHA